MIAKGKRLTAWVLFLALLLSAVTAFAGEKSAEEGTSAENLRQEESAQDKEFSLPETSNTTVEDKLMARHCWVP